MNGKIDLQTFPSLSIKTDASIITPKGFGMFLANPRAKVGHLPMPQVTTFSAKHQA
jgi:hypothetical protein